MKKSHIATLLIFLIAIPATLVLGIQLPGKWYMLTTSLVIAEILIPFFLAFEGRKPQARELVIMAVMCALAVAARVAIVIPNFKAIYGIVMIAGIALGPEPGFLVGAIAAFVSNFFRGQGIWTPWQMLAYGGCGMLMGFLFRKGKYEGLPDPKTGSCCAWSRHRSSAERRRIRSGNRYFLCSSIGSRSCSTVDGMGNRFGK